MNTTSTLRREMFAATPATTLRVDTIDADVVVRHEVTDTAVVEVSAREEVDLAPVEISSSGADISVRVPPLLVDGNGRRGLAIDLGFVSFSVGNARVRGLRIEVVLPEGASVDLTTKSGDVTVAGPSGSVGARTGAGDVRVEVADAIEAHTGSGDIVVGRSRCLVATTGTGDVVVVHVGEDAQLRTGSGDVRVEHASGTFGGASGSGDLRVERFDGDTVTLRTGSGDIRVGVPRGVPVWQDVNSASGDVTSELESAGQPGESEPFLTVRATTASGDVTLVNA